MMEDVQKELKKVCLLCRSQVGDDYLKCPYDGGELVHTSFDRLIGSVFANRYKILKVAGHGGMSTVYKAQHTYMERIVAVKMLHSHLVNDPISIQRFQQEAKAASSLTHTNIITVYDFGVSDGDNQAFLVMDYLEGPTIGDLIDRGGPIAEREAVTIFRQVCKGLVHAHSKGVVHRDLKPRNLVLTVEEDGSILVKIVDFGIAKIIPTEGGETQHLTQTGEVFGSPIYMSPEQCSGDKLDARSDLYSLGCVMYEILTGLPPLVGQNAVETMSMHVHDKPLPFAEIDRTLKISPQLEEVVFTCLEKKPKKRFQSAREILDALPRVDDLSENTDLTGTVAMRIGDMATSAEQRPLRTRKDLRRRRFRITSKAVAICFGILLVPLVLSLVVYQGPDEDPGTPLAKLVWQGFICLGDVFSRLQVNGLSIAALDQAAQMAENIDFMSSPQRFNFEKRMLTLEKRANVYAAMGKTKEQEEMTQEYVELDARRWREQAASWIEDLDKSQKYIEQLNKQGEPIQTHLSEPDLNWAGFVRPIIEVARRNEANSNFEVELELLTKSEKVITELYGADYVGLADLMLQKAQCLKLEDRIEDIDDDRLYEKA
ncbi:MAG: serine/threonine protein kinase, partial [Cyanobacteria bacterium]|nr:serine/threonine protein kinase [Cyanobacteriota bacterium]